MIFDLYVVSEVVRKKLLKMSAPRVSFYCNGLHKAISKIIIQSDSYIQGFFVQK